MRSARRAARYALLVALVAACSPSGDDEGGGSSSAPPTPGCVEGTPGCLGWQTCPPETSPDPEGGGCREILPPGACGPGSMAVLGSADCRPVGPEACAPGFRKAASGWGCEAIVAPKACEGATRESLGDPACVPVGDCAAPFPPAGTTHFVDAAYADGQLDATHFRKIGDAIAAAPAGAVIAVEAGTYPEGIEAVRSVSIVGRCAEKVRLVGTGLDVWGVLANRVAGVSLKGVTLEDHYEGVRAQGGGTVTLTDVVVESPRSVGLIAWQNGSKIVAERTVVRGVKPHPTRQTAPVVSANADEGGVVELTSSSIVRSWHAGLLATNPDQPKRTSSIVLRRSIVRDTNIVERTDAGAALVVSGHSRGEVTESAILAARRIGAVAFGAGASLDVSGSVVQTGLEDKSGETGAGVFVMDGAAVKVVDTTVREAMQLGVGSLGKGTTLTLSRVVVEGTLPGADGDFGIGAWADYGGALDVERSAFVSNAYYGVGLYGAGTTAKLTDVLVAGTRPSKADKLGRGVSVEDGASATLDRVTLARNASESLFVRGETAAGARATATARRLLVMDALALKSGALGVGISVERGAALDLDVGAILRARAAGVSISDLPGGAGSVAEATIAHTIVRDTLGGGDAAADTKTDIISGAGILSGGKLTLRASAVIGSRQFGVLVANPAAVPVISSCVIASTAPGANTGDYGHGIVAMTVPAVIVRDTIVRSNSVGLAFDRAAGVVSGVLVQSNAVGINVQGDGFALTTAKSAPEAPAPDQVVVTEDSRFVDNATRVGNGPLPLPASPLGGASGEGAARPKPGAL
jgi:hypothetical protein